MDAGLMSVYVCWYNLRQKQNNLDKCVPTKIGTFIVSNCISYLKIRRQVKKMF